MKDDHLAERITLKSNIITVILSLNPQNVIFDKNLCKIAVTSSQNTFKNIHL